MPVAAALSDKPILPPGVDTMPHARGDKTAAIPNVVEAEVVTVSTYAGVKIAILLYRITSQNMIVAKRLKVNSHIKTIVE